MVSSRNMGGVYSGADSWVTFLGFDKVDFVPLVTRGAE